MTKGYTPDEAPARPKAPRGGSGAVRSEPEVLALAELRATVAKVNRGFELLAEMGIEFSAGLELVHQTTIDGRDITYPKVWFRVK